MFAVNFSYYLSNCFSRWVYICDLYLKTTEILRRIFILFYSLFFFLLAFNNASARSVDSRLNGEEIFYLPLDRLHHSIGLSQEAKAHFEVHVEHPEQKEAARLSKRRNSDDHFSIVFLDSPVSIPNSFFVKITDHPKHGIIPSSIRQSSYYDFLFRLSLF